MLIRFVKFLGVGGLNTLFGLTVYTLFALTDLSTLIVLIAANIATVAFNFFSTSGLVFRDLSLKRVPRFILSYGIILLINWELIEFLSPIIGGRISAMAMIAFPMALLSYFLQTLFVFRVNQTNQACQKYGK